MITEKKGEGEFAHPPPLSISLSPKKTQKIKSFVEMLGEAKPKSIDDIKKPTWASAKYCHPIFLYSR